MEAWQPARVIDRGFRRTAVDDAGKDDFVRNKFSQSQRIERVDYDDADAKSYSSARRSTYSRNHAPSLNGENIQQRNIQPRDEQNGHGHSERKISNAYILQTQSECSSPLERLRQILFRRGPRIAIALKRQLQVIILSYLSSWMTTTMIT